MLVLVALFALMASLLGALALVALAPVQGRRRAAGSRRSPSAERAARRSGPRRRWVELPSDVPDHSWNARDAGLAAAA